MSSIPFWKPGPTECTHCGRDLRQITLTWTVRGSKSAFCSKLCRSTETREEVDGTPPAKGSCAGQTGPLPVVVKERAAAPAKPTAPVKEPSARLPKPGVLPATPRRERSTPSPVAADAPAAAPKPARAPRASSGGLSGIIKLVPGAKRLNPEGNRGRIFGLAKDGMTVAEHEALVVAAGLGDEYRSNMNVMIKNGCIILTEGK